jgi:hypothetical protein
LAAEVMRQLAKDVLDVLKFLGAFVLLVYVLHEDSLRPLWAWLRHAWACLSR